MKYVEFIQTDGYCWFDTTIVPTINTEVQCSFSPLQQTGQWNVYYGSQSRDDGPDSFQVRRQASYMNFSLFVGSKQVYSPSNTFALGDWLQTTLNKTSFTYSVNSGTSNTVSVNSNSFTTATYSMYIGAVNNPQWFPMGDSIDDYRPGRGSIAKYGVFKIYENGVLVADLHPAENNGSLGFYDEVTSTFRPNLGTGTPVAGPDLSSISAAPSKTSLAATGETINITVTCENAWTVTGNTFITLSSTGDTGSTTITVTAPSYSGATARTDTLTFIDSVTSDEASLTISQKKYQSGQPFYLGGDEVGECYIGGDAVFEAYLGEDLVYSSGPFQGLKLSPKELKFRNTTIATGDTQSFYVKSSEDWTISTDADWFTLSPASGVGNSQKTEVTLTVISIPSAETTNTVTCTSANYSASAGTLYRVGYGIPDNEIWYATQDNSRITNINNWRVYDKNGVQMSNSTVDFSTYGKMVFPRAIGYVAGDVYNTGFNWNKLTEIGFPEMEPSLCTGANDFGMRYFNNKLQYWTRIYGDYPYISEDETHMWGSDGTGGAYVRGKTGTLTITEGVKTLGSYALNYASFDSIIFPTTFTGMTGYNDGNAIFQYAMEDMSSLTFIKYQTPALPPIQSRNAFNGVNSQGTVLYPCGGTGYGGNLKPSNFTWEAYGC